LVPVEPNIKEGKPPPPPQKEERVKLEKSFFPQKTYRTVPVSNLFK
jgi:hypothetical protein